MHYKSLDSALIAYSSMNGRYFAGKQVIVLIHSSKDCQF